MKHQVSDHVEEVPFEDEETVLGQQRSSELIMNQDEDESPVRQYEKNEEEN